MSSNSGYQVGGSAGTSPGSDASPTKAGYWSLSKCKKAYLDYLGNKTDEIEEAKNARRYYHSSQWTEEQIKTLNKRKQPVVTFNRIGRKIDGVVGLIERLRQDPKAFPRTPQHEEGADLATAAIRYVLDEQEWKAKSPEVARDGAVDGIGGISFELTDGDRGDTEVAFDITESDSFFYDPRSYRADFTDATYMGEGKWLDLEAAVDFAIQAGAAQDKIDLIKNGSENVGTEFTTNPDRENKWFNQSGSRKLVRLIDIWYKHKGTWCWALFTGSAVILEGSAKDAGFEDEKGRGFCKYVMYSGNVDHDGDRYGFVRNMKSAQDEYNSRRSRALFTANSRRLILSQGAVADIETARREWARPDGVVVVTGNNVNEGAKADDQSFDFAGQLKLMENAIQELENYGPNQALIGDQSNQSGRAIQLLQQAGMAELGPYILQYRGWKIRVYRAIWNLVRKNWTAERWVRVTDDENLPNLIQINGVGVDPNTGMPTLINSIAALDVDIIIDEGQDSINMQADAYDTLTVMASKGANIPPAVLIELSPLPGSTKKKLMDIIQKPDPAKQQAQQTQLAGEAAKVDETKSKTMLNVANAHKAAQPEMGAPQKPEKYELPPEIQNAQAIAEIRDKHSSADQKDAQAHKTSVEAALAPAQAEHQAVMDRANFEQGATDKAEDRKIATRAKERT